MKVALIPFQKNLVIRMDNIRFILIITFAMIVFMLQQAWQLDYGPKPEIAAVVDPVAGDAKEDLPQPAVHPYKQKPQNKILQLFHSQPYPLQILLK